MAELALDQAVPRFKENEDRLDTFVNSATGYTTSGGVSVQSIQQFLASIGSNGIDFVDNAKARFGTGNDLEIYHSGSGSFIRDTGTGDLTIDGSAISIQTASAERISVSASGINVTGTVEFDGLSGTGAVTITDIADEDNMSSNSATKLATQQSIKAYVDAQVGTADTLSEVLGLGNTTGGTDIAVSANDDITFTDSSKAIFGAGSDLQIYHDASNSYIKEAGTGNLFIDATSLRLRTGNGSETYLTADGNGSVDLYYDNVKNFETTTNGVKVTNASNISMDNTSSGQIKVQGSGYGFGIALDADAANLYTNSATRDLVFGVNETEVARVKPAGLDVTGNVGLSSTQPTITLTDTDGPYSSYIAKNGSVLTVDGDSVRVRSTAGTEYMRITSAGIDVTGNVEFDGLSGTGSVTVTDILDEDDMTSDSATALATQQSIKAYVDANAGGGSGGLPTTGGTMTGDLLFNDGVKAKYGTSSDLQIYHDGSNSYISDVGTGDIIVKGQYIRLQDEVGTNLLTADGNDAVSLYYGGASKLATTSSGIDVTGTAQADFMKISTPDAGGSPATTAILDIYGYEGRGAGIKIRDSVNSASGASNREWFVGSGYNQTGFNIGYAPLGNNSSYVNQSKLTIDTSGNVSIPSGDLLVQNTSPVIALKDTNGDAITSTPYVLYQSSTGSQLGYIGYGSSSNGKLNIVNSNNDDITFFTDNTQRMAVTSAGIDVTGTVVADKMFVEGTANTRQWEAGSAGQKLAIYAYDNSTFYHRLETGNATNYQWGTYDNIPIYTITNNTVKTTLLANGKFGLGITGPTAKMHIKDVTNTSGSTTGSTLLRLDNDVNGDLSQQKTFIDFALFDSNANEVPQVRIGAEVGPNSDANSTEKEGEGAFVIYTNNATTGGTTPTGLNERMRVDYLGNVGIGTTAPKAKTQFSSGGYATPVLGSVPANASMYVTPADTSYGLVVGMDNVAPRTWLQSQHTNGASVAYTLTLQEAGGNVGIGTANATAKLTVAGDLSVSSTIEVGSLTPNQDGAIEVGVIALGTPAIASTTSSTGLMNHIIFDNPNGAVGKINTLNSATSYLTSSDYRLKTDVQAMTGSIDRVKALRPVNFEWVVDGTRVDGFLAHEAQEVVPEAVDGEKDAMRDQQYVESEATGDIYTPAVDATYETIQVELTPAVDATYDEEGNELTPAVDATYEEQQQELTPAIDEVIHSSDVVEPDELEEGQLWRETTEKVMATRQVPDYQGIDQSKIVPLLTSALQDAIAKIEALETRLEALEA